jgi:hypothetical protein
MNWKLIIVGGLVFWLVTTLGTYVTDIGIHQKVLGTVYGEHSSFWLPELREDPPDMEALMPRWLATSALSSFVVAGIFSFVYGSFNGRGWRKGGSWGLCLATFSFATLLALSVIINLPMKIWIWWGIEGLLLLTTGGAAMGWVTERWQGKER